MSLHKLDANGKPIRAGSRQKPAERDGKFHWRFQLRKSPKNPRDITRHFWATEAEAPAIVAAIQAGKPTELANGLTWNEAFKRWQDGHPLVSAKHVENQGRNIRYLCEFAKNANLTIEETTKALFREWLNERAKVSVISANRAANISSIARYAYRELDLLAEPPACLGIKKFSEPETGRQAMPLDKIGEYLTAAEKYYGAGLSLVAEFILFAGIRSTEAATLTEDMVGDEITILQKAKGAGKRPASIIVDQHIKNIIERARTHKKAFLDECRAAIEKARADEKQFAKNKLRSRRCRVKIDTMERSIRNASGKHIFINSAGSPWNNDSIRRHWAMICEKGGLEYYCPHELRHTHATVAGDSGFSERFIQAGMRWDDSSMAKRYVHETKRMATEVSATVRGKLAEALNGKTCDSKQQVAVKGIKKKTEITCPCCGKTITLVQNNLP